MSPRPLAVSAACLVGAAAALITAVLFSLNAPWAVRPTAGERAVAFAAVAVTVTALYGMWRMRRWGVMLLATLLALRIAYGFVAGLPLNQPALAGPVLMMVVGLVYVRKMT